MYAKPLNLCVRMTPIDLRVFNSIFSTCARRTFIVQIFKYGRIKFIEIAYFGPIVLGNHIKLHGFIVFNN